MLLGLAGEEPVRHVGLGMRSMDDVSLLAFMGGLEQVVSRFVGEEGVMKQLGPILRAATRDFGFTPFTQNAFLPHF